MEEIFKRYLKWAPVSLAIREVSRISAFNILHEKFNLFHADKILDVGCGDGHWWLNLLPDELSKIHGVDISPREVGLAQKLITAKVVDVSSPEFALEYAEESFDLVIGNCSLEHVFHLDAALQNIQRVLRPGGRFVLFVPTPYWALKGRSVSFLNKMSPRLSMTVSGMMNGFFQHWHLYHYKIWESLLRNFNFRNPQAFGLGNAKTEFLFRLFLPSAFISFLFKVVTGKYLNYFISPLVPNFILNKATHYFSSKLDSSLRAPNDNEIFEYILVCEK